ncbi:MAG: ABC transporter ATP-binding protein [Desulfobacteraceae bacterium]
MEENSGFAVVIEDLAKQYAGSGRMALDGLSLNIGAGEIFGLLGPNGAGKTTAISILSTILQPSRGRVAICDIDILAHPKPVRRCIGLVPQEIALYPELTARENLAFFGSLHGLGGSHLKRLIDSALYAVGLDQSAHRKVSAFSGGMKRRANLAAGMLHDPRVLFLDEPTVGVDAQSRQMIMEKLQEIRNSGTTMIYTTHYMEEARQLCDRIAIMDNGRILVMGKPSELLEAHPLCSDLGELFITLTGKDLRD